MNSGVLEEAYAHCQQICRDASTTFFSSFSVLEFEKRRAVHAVYALCRLVDDIVDGDEIPDVLVTDELILQTAKRDELLRGGRSNLEPTNSAEIHKKRLMALVSIRNDLKRASLGDIQNKDQLIFVALQDVFRRYPVRLRDFETVIDGMEDDLFPILSNTWDDLCSYCYKVASSVGLILIEIYGYDGQGAQLHAIDLGIQMQLINVLRDVVEDLGQGRVYLPKNVLAAHNISVDDLSKSNLAENPSWHSFIEEYYGVVKRHQDSAVCLFDYLGPRSRIQPKIMLDVYSKILYEIVVRRSGDVFTSPLKLTLRSKISLWIKINYMKLRIKMVAN